MDVSATETFKLPTIVFKIYMVVGASGLCFCTFLKDPSRTLGCAMAEEREGTIGEMEEVEGALQAFQTQRRYTPGKKSMEPEKITLLFKWLLLFQRV